MADSDVTIIIPTHRRDAFLEEAIASVVGQRVPPAELVVSDDVGSSRTAEVVARWREEAPFPVRYLDSSGPGAGTAGASRNAGAALATTGCVAFRADDDVWDATILAATPEMVEADDVDFAVAWTAADVPGFEFARMTPGLAARDVVARNPGFVGSNFVMRTEAFRSLGGFDPTLPVSNDKDLLVRALQAGLRYGVVAQELVTNRIHGFGQLTDKSPERVEGVHRYMAKHAALLRPRDELYLRGQLASVRRVAAPSAVARLRHTAELLWLRTRLAFPARS